MLCRLCCFRPVCNVRSFSTTICFTGWGCQPHAQPPTWRTRVSLFVWVNTFDLSGTWCHTSSVTTASTALRIIWPHKPHHYVKVGITFRWGETLTKMFQFHKSSKYNTEFQKHLQVTPSPEGAFFRWHRHLKKAPVGNICVVFLTSVIQILYNHNNIFSMPDIQQSGFRLVNKKLISRCKVWLEKRILVICGSRIFIS